MNVLRSTLSSYRLHFLVQSMRNVCWVGGYTLLFAVNWKVAVGLFLVQLSTSGREEKT